MTAWEWHAAVVPSSRRDCRVLPSCSLGNTSEQDGTAYVDGQRLSKPAMDLWLHMHACMLACCMDIDSHLPACQLHAAAALSSPQTHPRGAWIWNAPDVQVTIQLSLDLPAMAQQPLGGVYCRKGSE